MRTPAPNQQNGPSSRAKPSPESLYYVYAIVRSRLGGASQPAPWPAEGIVLGASTYALAHRDIMAIVSPVPLSEFGPGRLEANLEDPDWTRDRVLAHQRVVAAFLGAYTVIPLKFCTLFSTEAGIREVLSRHYETLDRMLDRLEGAIEWGVKLYCNRQQLVEWVQATSAALQPLRAQIAQASGGAVYFLNKKLERAAMAEAEQVVTRWVDEIHRRLAGLSREVVINPVQSPQVHGRPAEMVLNGAYLVDETESEAFRRDLTGLMADSAARGFDCQLTGPWPPYNFATFELSLS